MGSSSHRSLSAVALFWVLAIGCTAPSARYEAEREKLGTSFRIVLYAPSTDRAQGAMEAAFARVDELDGLLSDYDPESELSRVSAMSDDAPGVPVRVSAELTSVLAASLRWAELSDGAFDPTLGPMVRLWRRSARQGELPAPERLEAARAAVGWRSLAVDEGAREVTLELRGMRLDLGGIAKGYVLDECLRVLAQHGIERALVDGGGDVVVGLAPPGERGWSVRVDGFGDGSGEVVLLLERCAVATSGDAFKAVEIEGLRYSHVLDAQTGLGLIRRSAATVVAPDGMTADALATAACVTGGERALALLAEVSGVEGRVLEAVAGELEPFETPGFAALELD